MKPEDVKIIFPVDVSTEAAAAKLLVEVGKHINIAKVGLELIHNIGTPQAIYRAHCSVGEVFADVKLNDIPSTVAGAARGLVRNRADYFNVMASGCEEMMSGAVKATYDEGKKLEKKRPKIIAVTVLTTLRGEDLAKLGISPPKEVSLMSKEEEQKFISDTVMKWSEMAVNAGVDIILCSPAEAKAVHSRWPDIPIFTPNVRLPSSPPDDQNKNRTMTPGEAALCGSQGLVIGRPIRNPEGGKTREQVIEEIRKDIAQALA